MGFLLTIIGLALTPFNRAVGFFVIGVGICVLLSKVVEFKIRAGKASLRWVPILTGVFWTAVAVAIFVIWHPQEGFWYWVHRVGVSLPLAFGLHSLWIGFFLSNDRVRNLVAGRPVDRLF